MSVFLGKSINVVSLFVFFKERKAAKLSKEALTKSPKEKNPDEQIGYEKVIYFGYLLMKHLQGTENS